MNVFRVSGWGIFNMHLNRIELFVYKIIFTLQLRSPIISFSSIMYAICTFDYTIGTIFRYLQECQPIHDYLLFKGDDLIVLCFLRD